uniref:Uncharacterized protein n=1 Tax=Bionectria ochroleuca TaxID=29856 RepID=A0A8H7NMU8_BIOOC
MSVSVPRSSFPSADLTDDLQLLRAPSDLPLRNIADMGANGGTSYLNLAPCKPSTPGEQNSFSEISNNGTHHLQPQAVSASSPRRLDLPHSSRPTGGSPTMSFIISPGRFLRSNATY